MMGLHAFENEKNRFSSEWCAQWFQLVYNFFLSLGFDKTHLHFNEDYWKGDGNKGSSIEFFYGGVELGNLVFIDEYQVESGNGDVQRDFKILDVGLGFERILDATGYTPPYMKDAVKDHLRSFIIGTYDGALCSKIGMGYSMRKLLERVDHLTGMSYDQLEPLILEIIQDLKEYYDTPFENVLPRLKRIYMLEVERIR